MRTGPALLAVVGVCAALALTACDSGDDSGARAAALDAGCLVTVPSAAQPSSTPGSTPATGQRAGSRDEVGVIVPATAPATGPGPGDLALLGGSLRRAGLVPVVRAAHEGGPSPAAIARTLVGDGIRVLVIGVGDPGAVARAEHVAELAGVQVVEYGGVALGGTAAYAVLPDYEQIGRLEARTMVRCLEARGLSRPKIILVDGGTDVDQNAVLLDVGAHRVLDPLVSAGRVQLVEETSVPGWRADRAAEVFTQALDLAGGQVDGVIAADDTVATAVIGVLGRRRLAATLVAGQGSGPDGLLHIASGQQSLTVHTDLEREADAAAQLARALVTGDRRALVALPLAGFDDPLAPSRDLQALMVPGQAVTAAAGSSALHPSRSP